MEIKLFEVRDHMTFIPCIAIRMGSTDERERWLMGRCGYGVTISAQKEHILFGRLDGSCRLLADPWGGHRSGRTIRAAHNYAIGNWNKLKSGDVIDVEFIEGESDAPKVSEGPIPPPISDEHKNTLKLLLNGFIRATQNGISIKQSESVLHDFCAEHSLFDTRYLQHCKEHNILPMRGWPVQTDRILVKMGLGILISEEIKEQRKPGVEGYYVDFVAGHGGDVWWVIHRDGTFAPYMFTEVYDRESGS